MTTYQPATEHSNSIKRPDCPKCGTGMNLFGIEADGPVFELHSFECPKGVVPLRALPIRYKPRSQRQRLR